MAGKIRLSVAVGDYEIVRALKEGTVEADGLDLVVLTGHGPRERHWRMARRREFDVCEFNIGAYLMSRDRGEPLAAIPVFLHRRFRHGFAFINIASGIREPRDLIGKRVGGTNFQPAGNIWLRGILEEHYGVPHKEITWVVDRSEDVPFTPPAGLKIEMIPPAKSLDAMLAEGEIPAPQAFLIQQDPRTLIRSHFHAQDQFQVVAEGGGMLGRHALSPLSVHFASRYTGYGPITSGDEGLSYFTLRAVTTPRAYFLPEAREELADAPRRNLYGPRVSPTSRDALREPNVTCRAT